MNKNEVLSGLYTFLIENIPNAALSLIIQNDIRVENFFSIYSGIYLNNLLENNLINNYSFQHTILLENPRRAHIDIMFIDNNNETTYLELKHFSITQNRGNVRNLNFYTSNTLEGKKVGIVGDCMKLDNLREIGYIPDEINLVCLAFITHRPTQEQFNNMEIRLNNHPELFDWNITYPIPIENQNNELGFFTLQK
jgi:hypothetical protein